MSKPDNSDCDHKEDVYLSRGPILYQDPLVGWVVDVRCGKCGRDGIAQIDYKNANWEDAVE
jgi:hypothetical protein